MLVLTAGTLAVTNAAGTGRLQVNWGTAGKGRLYLDGGTLIADHLDATNVLGSAGMDYIKRGTLITKGDSRLHQSGSTILHIGAHFSMPGEWKIVGGTNTVEQAIYLTSNIGGYSKGCRGYLTVDGPHTHLNAVTVQLSAGGSGYITVTNGGTAVLSGILTVGYFNDTNHVTVSGAGSVLNTKNQVWIYPRNVGAMLRIEEGGTWEHNTGNQVYLSNGGAKGTNEAQIVVDGPGSTFVGWGTLEIGGLNTIRPQGGGILRVINGGVASNSAGWTQVLLGSGQGGYGTLAVEGAGSAFLHSGTLAAGTNALPAGSTVMLGSGNIRVTDGGLIESRIYLGENGTGNLLCDGGTLQFTLVDPVLNVKCPGAAVVTNGTLSFRGVIGADVRAHLAGTRLTNLVYRGRNAFRLNQATNAASGQDYTFDDTGDPLNFVRLELAGGRYRGGCATIGTNGALRIEGDGNLIDQVLENFGRVEGRGTLAGTVNHRAGSTLAPGTAGTAGILTLAGTHTLSPGATLAIDLNGTAPGQFDALAVAEGGSLDLSDAGLAVTLGGPVAIGDTFTIVDAAAGTLTGSLAVNDLTVVQDGKTRVLCVSQTQDAVRLVVAPPGSLFIVR